MPIIVVPIDKPWRGVHLHIAESTDLGQLLVGNRIWRRAARSTDQPGRVRSSASIVGRNAATDPNQTTCAVIRGTSQEALAVST